MEEASSRFVQNFGKLPKLYDIPPLFGIIQTEKKLGRKDDTPKKFRGLLTMHILDVLHIFVVLTILKLGHLGWLEVTVPAIFYQFIVAVNEANMLVQGHTLYIEAKRINLILREFRKLRNFVLSDQSVSKRSTKPDELRDYNLSVKLWIYFLHFLAVNLALTFLCVATVPLLGSIDTGYLLVTAVSLNSSNWADSLIGKTIRIIFSSLFSCHWYFVAITIFISAIVTILLPSEILTILGNRSKLCKLTYESLRILIFRFNETVKWVLAMELLVISIMFVSSVYASLRLNDKMPLQTCIMFPIVAVLMVVAAVLIYSCGGKVLTRSEKYVEKWERIAKRDGGGGISGKVAIRVWRAVRPIGLEIGSFGSLPKMSILYLFEVWVEQTIALLLIE
ncbi:hypothetical protein Fcan01_24334 [Folsomia candida]|uniref:Uncharacterized protein n=1 Tax=Folsomia candida TaxID=158441 RepID=A0A226D895_FOLCA|nr:hypothetical protein Fcan01_24334 [Folsomia candida]